MIAVMWRRLPIRYQILTGRVLAAVLLKLIDTGLQRVGYRRLCRWLIRLSPKPVATRVDMPRARAIATIINQSAESPPVEVNCLRRSVALWYLLRWMRLPSAIRIGLNPDGGHAWVEHGNRVINDTSDVVSQYAILYGDELSPEVISRIS